MSPSHGFSLPEALVSLALSGVVLAAALPAVTSMQRLARSAAERGDRLERLEGARLSLTRDLRRAGFGSPGRALEADGDALVLRHLEGGFAGGIGVAAPAAAGEQRLLLEAAGSLRPGDAVVLIDRLERRHDTRLSGVDRGLAEVVLLDGLPFPAGPSHGTQLYRVAVVEWQADGSGLRRQGQTLLDGPVRLQVQTASGGAFAEWLAGGSAEAAATTSASNVVRVDFAQPAPVPFRLLALPGTGSPLP